MAACTWLYYTWLGWYCYDKVCYDDLGCFENKPPFHNANYELPQSPQEQQIRFLLYTTTNSDVPMSLTPNASEIATTAFNGTDRTIVIIHGFVQGPNVNWIIDAKNAILQKEKANIIVVDWEKGADFLTNYYQAAANTRVVGALTAKLMTSLVTSAGANFENMYIIGYSAGAHIAGYAGERLTNLGRITGLDPAYTAFTKATAIVRLDRTDAKFVDIIHTDGQQLIWGFGIPVPIGHVDFYPNGGLDQPGCSGWSFLLSSNCDHRRATEYFVESITSSCKFKSTRCRNYRRYKRGRCTCKKNCAKMGFYTEPGRRNGKYYLKTNKKAPFCKS